MENGSFLKGLADFPDANALQEVAQPTGITFTGVVTAMHLNVTGELEVRDRALVMNVFILKEKKKIAGTAATSFHLLDVPTF